MRLTFKSQMAMVCLLFAALTVNPAMVRSEQIFYSIHYGTVINLTNLEIQVNALKVKGLTVFWGKSELPDMGAFKNRRKVTGLSFCLFAP